MRPTCYHPFFVFLCQGNNGQKLGKLASLGGWHGNSLLPLLLLSGNHLLGKLDPLSLLLLTSGKSNTLTSVLLLQHLRKQGVAIGPLHTIALLGGLGKFGGHGLFGAHAFGPFGGIGHLNPLLLLLLASSHKADHPDRILPDQLLKSAPKEWADILHGAVPPPPALPSSYKYPEFVSLPDNSWADKLPSAFEYDGKSSDLASSYDHFWTSPMSTSAPPASRSKTIASKSPNKSKQKF